MIIIGIDQSLSYTGISIVNESKELVECIAVKPKNNGVERLDFITAAIIKSVMDCASAHPQQNMTVVREGYSYGSISSSVFNLGELGGCIDLTLYKLARNIKTLVPSYDGKLSEYCIPPTTWKKLIFGAGNTQKDTTYLLKALKKTGIEFQNDNDADSYMIAVGFMIMRSISSEGSIPSNFTLEQREACLTPSLRKKNKITKSNISNVSEELFRELAVQSLKEYMEFE